MWPPFTPANAPGFPDWALVHQKNSDFDSIFFYGSVQVSAAQICKNFENRYVRTDFTGKKLTENGLFWAQFRPNSEMGFFGPIDFIFTSNQG